jgi:hypothetical protein
MNLSLGTAQFGNAYGITNKYGKPSQDDAFNIAELFINCGGRFVDTAKEYKNSKVIANILRNRKNKDEDINLTSKIFLNCSEDISNIINDIEKHCEDLQIKTLYGLFIHNPSKLIDHQFNLAELKRNIVSLKNKKLIHKFGISVYSPEELYSLHTHLDSIDIIQCPVNILDQRFLQNSFQEFVSKYNIEVHARSLFLQGILLADTLPKEITNRAVIKLYRQYESFLKAHNITKMQACYEFACQNTQKIDCWVLGFNRPSEIEEFLNQPKQKKVDVKFDSIISKNRYIDPRTWRYK